MPRGSAPPNDCPTPIIQWFSIIGRFLRGGKIIMNGYVFRRGDHDSEFGWTTRRRQNDDKWIQLVAGNKFSETVCRVQAWRFAGATAYVMNSNLLLCDCTDINTAQFWGPIEQFEHNKATKYQTTSHYDLLNHGYKYISARPVGNNAAWRCLLVAGWQDNMDRAFVEWSVIVFDAVRQWNRRGIKYCGKNLYFSDVFNQATKRLTSSKNSKLLPTIWDIVTASVCSFH